MSLRTAIDHFRAGQSGQPALMRAVAEADPVFSQAIYRDYEVRAITTGDANGRRQDLYTDAALVPGSLSASMTAAWALWTIDPRIKVVTVDRGSDHELVFSADQLPALFQWGRTILVERWCSTGTAPRGAAALLRSYRFFLGVVDEATTELRRHDGAVALFTARDALDAWISAHPGGEPWEMRALQIAGLLADDTPVVLNPAGPRGPFAIPDSMQRTLAGMLHGHKLDVSLRRYVERWGAKKR